MGYQENYEIMKSVVEREGLTYFLDHHTSLIAVMDTEFKAIVSDIEDLEIAKEQALDDLYEYYEGQLEFYKLESRVK